MHRETKNDQKHAHKLESIQTHTYMSRTDGVDELDMKSYYTSTNGYKVVADRRSTVSVRIVNCEYSASNKDDTWITYKCTDNYVVYLNKLDIEQYQVQNIIQCLKCTGDGTCIYVHWYAYVRLNSIFVGNDTIV